MLIVVKISFIFNCFIFYILVCSSFFCKYFVICIDGVIINDYICVCIVGYFGINCDIVDGMLYVYWSINSVN